MRFHSLAAAVTTALLASRAVAQPAPAPDNFGTQDGIDLWIPASQFTGGQGWYLFLDGYWSPFDLAGSRVYEAYVPLPQGAFLQSMRIFYVDFHAQDIHVELVKYREPGNPDPDRQVLASFDSAGMPGYANESIPLDHTIDLREDAAGGPPQLAAAFYQLSVLMPSTYSVGFKGVRLFWRRQVSPAPQGATFGDVPTNHPFFQFVEALATSGITAGCGGGNYCPDNPLTRGQMAVFLAKALGLHWPPF
jgi:S-layer homology domain